MLTENKTKKEHDKEKMLALALEKRSLLNFYANQCYDILKEISIKINSDRLKRAQKSVENLEKVIKDFHRNLIELSLIESSIKENEKS